MARRLRERRASGSQYSAKRLEPCACVVCGLSVWTAQIFGAVSEMTDERDALTGELGALREFWELQAAAVYHGRGVPRGSGSPVVVVPGLFGTDHYLRPIRTWLQRIGYSPRMSTLRINVGCPQRLLEQIERSLENCLVDHPRVAIIGHSRGGMLGKAIATRLGARCSHFIALGSPVGGILRGGREELLALANPRSRKAQTQPLASRQVADAGRRAMRLFDPECDYPACDCRYLTELCAPLDAATNVAAIYSRDDQVVPARACPIDGARNIEVGGTHSGLVFNKAVYPHIAEVLQS